MIPTRVGVAQIHHYFANTHCKFQPGSHLSVVNPTNIPELFSRVNPRLAPLARTKSAVLR